MRPDPSTIIGPPKAILYLDQLVISNITKLLDPDSPRRKRVIQDPFWLELYKKLDRLLSLQLIVCPASHYHRAESLISGEPSFESLQAVYSYLSNGCTFKDALATLDWQVQHYFREYVEGHPDHEPEIPASDFIIGDPHEWQSRVGVTVAYRSDASEVATLRDQRAKQHSSIEEVFRVWQLDQTPFALSAQEEAQALGRAIVKQFQSYNLRWLSPASPLDLLPPPAVILVHNMCRTLAEYDLTDPIEQLKEVSDYFQSPHFLRVPFVRLSSMLYAAIARKAHAGRKAPPNEGTITDVTAIAAMLPYCQAMVLDREMAGYLREAPLKEEVERFGTRIFALKTRAEFLAYLHELEARAGEGHVALVKAEYGEAWLDTFRGVVSQERKSRERE